MKEIGIKVNKKNLIRDVFESYRELPSYKSSLVDIYTTIKDIRNVPEGHNNIQNTNDSWLLSEILREITRLKSRLQELEQGNSQSENSNSDYIR